MTLNGLNPKIWVDSQPSLNRVEGLEFIVGAGARMRVLRDSENGKHRPSSLNGLISFVNPELATHIQWAFRPAPELLHVSLLPELSSPGLHLLRANSFWREGSEVAI